MKPGPRLACAVLIQRIDILAPPRDTVDWLTEIIEARGWAARAASAREKAEQWADAFLNYLRLELGELNRLGRYAPFAFNSSAEYKFRGRPLLNRQSHCRCRSKRGAELVLVSMCPRCGQSIPGNSSACAP